MTHEFDGAVTVHAQLGQFRTNPTITLDGANGKVILDNIDQKRGIYLDNSGVMEIYERNGPRLLALRSHAFDGPAMAALWIGAHPSDPAPIPGPKSGCVIVRNNTGSDSIVVNGGTHSIYLRNNTGSDSIVVNGISGDIFLNNADCAEDFDISNSAKIEPGTVMVIEQEGKLKECDLPYDKRVAGVISGAGDYKPGLVLDKKQSTNSRKSISLMGKVFCKVDAQTSPVEVGDLLTTSATPGHAMKAEDPTKAFGSVIGKALRPFKEGAGLIPILIALQ